MTQTSFTNKRADELRPFVTEEDLEELDKLENDRFNDDERAAFLAKYYVSREEREKIVDLFELGGLTRPEKIEEPIASIAPKFSNLKRSQRATLWNAVAIAAGILVCVAIFVPRDDDATKRTALRQKPEDFSPTTALEALPQSNRAKVGSTLAKSFALDEFGFLPNGAPMSKSIGEDWIQSETNDKNRDEDKIMDEIARRLKTTLEATEARRLFETLSPEAQKSVKGEILRGTIAFVAGDLDAAEQAFRAAFELEPDSFVTTYNLATTLYALDRTFEAKTYFDALKSYEEYKNNEPLQNQIDDLYSEGEEADEE